jgi:hypothetical protein
MLLRKGCRPVACFVVCAVHTARRVVAYLSSARLCERYDQLQHCSLAWRWHNLTSGIYLKHIDIFSDDTRWAAPHDIVNHDINYFHLS